MQLKSYGYLNIVYVISVSILAVILDFCSMTYGNIICYDLNIFIGIKATQIDI